MEILGIGASELLFILIIAIIVLGPRDMQKAGKTIGRWLNQLVRSDTWKVFQRTSAELRKLPQTLMREANIEIAEMERDLRNTIDPRTNLSSSSNPKNATTSPPPSQPRREYPPPEDPSPSDTEKPETRAESK
jgi:sec-independent protein translocase protein TatB